MPTYDGSSSARWGWPWRPIGDLVHTGQGSVLAVWLNSGKGWGGGLQVLFRPRPRGGSAFPGYMSASWSLRRLSTPEGASFHAFLRRARNHGNASHTDHVCLVQLRETWRLGAASGLPVSQVGPSWGQMQASSMEHKVHQIVPRGQILMYRSVQASPRAIYQLENPRPGWRGCWKIIWGQRSIWGKRASVESPRELGGRARRPSSASRP